MNKININLENFPGNWKRGCLNALITAFLLLFVTVLAYVYLGHAENYANIALLYILALVLIARLTTGYFWGIVASLVGVICVNFLFTYPYFSLNFTLTGYPVTFIGMLAISLITGTTTTHLKKQMKLIADREKLLIEAEKEKMRANLLRAVSHDLRTPLTGIIGAAASYLENSDYLNETEKKEQVAHILEDSNWLLNMVENLLSVTRIQNGGAKLTKTLEPVEEVVSEAVMRLRKRIPKAQITVQVPDEFILLPMDAMLIEQVIINLLENAVVHAQSTMPIACYVDQDEHNVTFHIRDYGVGISPEKKDTIFDGMPYSGTKAADSTKGMGIGLSICKTIIHAHKGTINFINHKTGTEFYFSLPKQSKKEIL